MSDLDFSGLDKHTEKMFKRLVEEYPKQSTQFLKKQVEGCKSEAERRTPRALKKPKAHAKSKHLQDNWKSFVKGKTNANIGVIRNNSPHAHLIENGHFTKNGGWVEGKHMLQDTMTNRQPKIDRAIESFVDQMLDL